MKTRDPITGVQSVKPVVRKFLLRYAGDAHRWGIEGRNGSEPLLELVKSLAWLTTVSDQNDVVVRLPRSLRRYFTHRPLLDFSFPRFDKSTWGDGPWQTEPDHDFWKSDSGLYCMIVRAHTTGALCGYVGLPLGHPLWGSDGDTLRCHGGITWRQSDLWTWWLGFDCGHCMDYQPAMMAGLRETSPELFQSLKAAYEREAFPGDRWGYRTYKYVRQEVEDLVVQVATLVAQNERKN